MSRAVRNELRGATGASGTNGFGLGSFRELLDRRDSVRALFPSLERGTYVEYGSTRMAAKILAKARAAVIRGLAVVAVVATYAVGSIGTQVAATVGFSTLALAASATPAGAWWRRGWGWRRPVVWGWGAPWGGGGVRR